MTKRTPGLFVFLLYLGCACGAKEPPATNGGSADAANPNAKTVPLKLPLNKTKPGRIVELDMVDRSKTAEQRTAWDNFTPSDSYSEEHTRGGVVPPPIRPLWARYVKDPVGSILRDGKIDFRIVSALYKTGVITKNNAVEFRQSLEKHLKESGSDDAMKGHYLIALVHLGFDEAAFATIEKYATEPWFRKNWDVNFYAGSLLFRYRLFEKARPFFETAVKLHPTKQTQLWLRLARVKTGAVQAGHEVFPLGKHMGSGTDQSFPFVDRADFYGMRRWHLAGAVSFFDMNNDSVVDWVASGVFAAPELYRFEQGQGYVRTHQAAFEEISNVPPGCIAADFDNDGYTDLYMTRAAWFGNGPNRLLRNINGTHFEDVSERSGDATLLDQNSCGAAALDFNKDGLVDLVVSGTAGGSVRLLKNEGKFVFRDVSVEAGLDVDNMAVTVSVTVGDIDNDGWPDFFVNRFSGVPGGNETPQSKPNALYRNLGNGRFVDEAAQRGVARGTPKGFGSWMFDFDNDGDLDILASNFADTDQDVYEGFQVAKPWSGRYWGSALYRNDGTGHFQNVGKKAGFVPSSVMGAQYVDFDLDGDFDVILGPGNHPLPGMQPLFVYRNDGQDRFTNITPLDNPIYYGKFHGIAFADLDRDGDPDLFVNNGGVLLSDRWRDLLLENQTEGKGWLHLRLEGVKSNRSAIGARVTVHVGDRIIMQEVASGQGFSSTNTPFLIFGLGDAQHVDKVQIRWPSGLSQELPPLASGQAIRVREGSSELDRVY